VRPMAYLQPTGERICRAANVETLKASEEVFLCYRRGRQANSDPARAKKYVYTDGSNGKGRNWPLSCAAPSV